MKKDNTETKPSGKLPDASTCSVGSWWLIEYGTVYHSFYVTDVGTTQAKFTLTDWLVDNGVWMTWREMSQRKAEFRGVGKLKWYWKYIPWRNCIPKYKSPNSKRCHGESRCDQ